jgi:hypothetical protein
MMAWIIKTTNYLTIVSVAGMKEKGHWEDLDITRE